MHPIFAARSKAALPIWFVTPSTFSKVLASLDKRAREFVKASGFEPRPGRHLVLPTSRGVAVLFGLDGKDGHNAFLPGLLPSLTWCLARGDEQRQGHVAGDRDLPFCGSGAALGLGQRAGAVARSLDLDDDGMVQQAVEQRGGDSTFANH